MMGAELTKKFELEFLQELIWSEPPEGVTCHHQEVTGEWRHGAEHLLVFEVDGVCWGWDYRTDTQGMGSIADNNGDGPHECRRMELVDVPTWRRVTS